MQRSMSEGGVTPPLPSTIGSIIDLEEEYSCCVCCDLIVMPTTLNCGHSFCRHCLAKWFDIGKKTECPTCRKNFVGYPMENIHMMNSLERLFGDRYSKRKEEVLDDKDNKKAIQEFDEILKKRYRNDNLSATSCGCLMGTVVVLVIITCFYMAFHWGSGEFDLLVKKPITKWTEKDVTDWLEDQGLYSYKERFTEEGINGRLLSEIEPTDLESLFNMSNPLHQRTFLHSLNYIKTYGVKPPTNLWEYKALNSAHATFLLYTMNMTPRLSILYLYFFDSETYHSYKNYALTCNATSTHAASTWWFYAGSVFTPHFIQAQFTWCFLDMHYWTSRIVLCQCIGRGLLDMVSLGTVSANSQVNPIILFIIYYLVSCVWGIVPTIIADALFYAELYFSPIYVFVELRKKFFNNN